MTKSVHKYTVPLNELRDVTKVRMPKNAVPISVANQRECLVVYALVKPDDAPEAVHHFRTAGTGHPITASTYAHGKFLGTVLFQNGNFVLHVWHLPE